ncbi:CubicO group peptidase (beta-lactamase class C family) [Sphingobium jiangsuense]|uniref:CubicO group peptidase (Beta-lactamase class C family) n=2 Tax=Sphingobium jiangsuense TaxID=870476 RepID=A0A7W6BCJ3_9SPHN|nr:CubicO group peptidase (beta-lactamase class C family) [Sphingobium jiangsuense]
MMGSINSKSRLCASAMLIILLMLSAVGLRGHAWSRPPATYVTLKGGEGVSRVALAKAVEPLFDARKVGTTQALLVMQGGKLIVERYGEGIGPETKLLSRGIGKTVTAALVGLMVSDGRLALDTPVPVEAWSQPGDPRGTITLRNLLQMTSGLEHRKEAGRPQESDTVRMLYTDGAQDMAAFAEAKPIADPPGSHFLYSTGDTLIIADLMTRMLTDSKRPDARRDAMMEFVRGRLMAPVGLDSLTPEFDARGTMIGGAMMHMTARDYARFGEFLRHRGRVNGHQVLSARWVGFMTTPSPRNPAYGGQLWLNREGRDNPLFPGRGSKRIFAAVGQQGQYLLVAPGQGLVVLRLGLTHGEDRTEALRDALARLVELFPSA